jgi:ribosomal protein S18 acetylase RimI-like enzyme
MIRAATLEDLFQVKLIAVENKSTLGFILQPSLELAVKKGWLLVAIEGETIVGFLNMWQRRDGWSTVMELCVQAGYRNRGYGRALLAATPRPIRLKCLANNTTANEFYYNTGFTLEKTIPATERKQALYLWNFL